MWTKTPKRRIQRAHKQKQIRQHDEANALKRSVADAARITTLSAAEHRELTNRIAAVYRRQARLAHRRDQILLGQLAAAAIFGMTGAGMILYLLSMWISDHKQFLNSSAHSQDLVLKTVASAALGGGAVGCALTVVLARAIRSWRTTQPTLAAPARLRVRFMENPVILLAAFPTFFLCVIGGCFALKSRHFSATSFLTGGVGTLGFAVFASTGGQIIAQLKKGAEALLDRGSELMPLDPAVKSWTRTAGSLIELSPAWSRRDVSRYLVDRLEAVAGRVEEAATWARRRAPVSRNSVRGASRRDYLLLAAVVREHKRALVAVRTRKDYDTVVASFTDGLLPVLRNDWPVLLANAPESIPKRRGFAHWSASCLLPGVLLAAAGVALPYLPPFHGTGAAVQGLRVTLIAYGVVKLIPGQQSVIDLLVGAFGRTGNSASK